MGTHTSCLRFFLGLPSLSSFCSPAAPRLAPCLRPAPPPPLLPTPPASSRASDEPEGPSTGDGVGSSLALALRTLDGPAAMASGGAGGGGRTVGRRGCRGEGEGEDGTATAIGDEGRRGRSRRAGAEHGGWLDGAVRWLCEGAEVGTGEGREKPSGREAGQRTSCTRSRSSSLSLSACPRRCLCGHRTVPLAAPALARENLQVRATRRRASISKSPPPASSDDAARAAREGNGLEARGLSGDEAAPTCLSG